MLVLSRKSRESVVSDGSGEFHRLLKVTVLATKDATPNKTETATTQTKDGKTRGESAVKAVMQQKKCARCATRNTDRRKSVKPTRNGLDEALSRTTAQTI